MPSPNPPQKKSNRMIQMQLLSPQPPLLPNKLLVPFPQQLESSNRIQIMEQHPFPSLHPQFVAAKSLMFEPPIFILQCIVWRRLIRCYLIIRYFFEMGNIRMDSHGIIGIIHHKTWDGAVWLFHVLTL